MKCQPRNFAFNIAVCVLLCVASYTQQSATSPSAKASSSALGAVSYNVSLADPEHHLVQVQIFIPAGQAEHELQLPVWNALYQVRDFSKYVNWIRAKDRAGNPLPVRKFETRRWEASGAQKGATDGNEVVAAAAAH